ncbi:MAG: hypothetical protein PHT94_01875 [Candidatus Nanoarchaeia archaeon]|nr:hypothetical protein [Candidatus Nanoarchaeia archaeon]
MKKDRFYYNNFFLTKISEIDDYLEILIEYFSEIYEENKMLIGSYNRKFEDSEEDYIQLIKQKMGENLELKNILENLYKKKYILKNMDKLISSLSKITKKEDLLYCIEEIIKNLTILKRSCFFSEKVNSFFSYKESSKINTKERIKKINKKIELTKKAFDDLINEFKNEKIYDNYILNKNNNKNNNSNNNSNDNVKFKNKEELFKDKDALLFILRKNLKNKKKKLFKKIIANKNVINLLIKNKINDELLMDVLEKDVEKYMFSGKTTNKEFYNFLENIYHKKINIYESMLNLLYNTINNILINSNLNKNLIKNSNLNLNISFVIEKEFYGCFLIQKSSEKEIHIILSLNEEFMQSLYLNDIQLPLETNFSRTIIHELTHSSDPIFYNFKNRINDIMDYGLDSLIKESFSKKKENKFDLEYVKNNLDNNKFLNLNKFYLIDNYRKIFYYLRVEGLANFSQLFSKINSINSNIKILFLKPYVLKYIENERKLKLKFNKILKKYFKENKKNESFFNDLFLNLYDSNERIIHDLSLSIMFIMFISNYNYDLFIPKSFESYNDLFKRQRIYVDIINTYKYLNEFNKKSERKYKKINYKKLKRLMNSKIYNNYFIIDSKENFDRNMSIFIKKISLMKLSDFFKEYENACKKLGLNYSIFTRDFLMKVISEEMKFINNDKLSMH